MQVSLRRSKLRRDGWHVPGCGAYAGKSLPPPETLWNTLRRNAYNAPRARVSASAAPLRSAPIEMTRPRASSSWVATCAGGARQ
jgi:hypothetical protein